MGEETLVLGAAIDLTADEVRPFLSSLRKAGYRGTVVLAVDRAVRRQLRQEAVSFDVQFLWTPTLLPLSFRSVHRSRALRTVWAALQGPLWSLLGLVDRLPVKAVTRTNLKMRMAQLLCTPMETRFLSYRRYLAKRPHARVLLLDVRDVLFQDDPFVALPVAGLGVSVENQRYTIAAEPRNAAWMKETYGQEMLDRIGGSPVSCVGVTYGDLRSISAYLELMAEEILRLPASAARRGGADTAIHNMLVWTDRLGPVTLLETLASPVATLNDIPAKDVQLSSDGRLLNRDGSKPSVLHQYDRLPGVASALLRALAT